MSARRIGRPRKTSERPDDAPLGATVERLDPASGPAVSEAASTAANGDPLAVIVGGAPYRVEYGFLDDVGLPYYDYVPNHGGVRNTQHGGVDVLVPCGTPLHAPAAGVVDCVGGAGMPRWGQRCGAYADVDGGGVGNITILLDPGTHKLTLGHCRTAQVRVGYRVEAGQQVGTVGSMNACHVHVEVSVPKGDSYWLVEPVAALREVVATQAGMSPAPLPDAPPAPKPPTGPIQTRRPGPGAPYGIDWGQITRWLPQIEAASARYPRAAVPLLAAMCVVESGGVHEQNGRVIERYDGYGGGPSVGMFQVKPQIWKSTYAYDAYTPAGNALMAAGIMDGAIRQYGSWQAALTTVYFPATDTDTGTTQTEYVRVVTDLMAEWRAAEPGPGWREHELVGAERPLRLPADIAFEAAIVPATQRNQRPGAAMMARWFTQHGTGNPRPGMDAEAHRRWIANGAPDDRGRSQQLGFHFVSDDARIIQLVPVNEIAWHAGDGGNGPGNLTSIGAEVCEHAGRDVARGEYIAAHLAAGVLRALGLPANALTTHARWVRGIPGGHVGCPASLLDHWDRYAATVAAAMGGAPVPPPNYAPTAPVPKEWDGTDYLAPSGARFMALRRVFVAGESGVSCRKWADPNAPEVRTPLRAGEAFTADYVVRGEDGRPWLVTGYGTRVPADDCAPALASFAGVEPGKTADLPAPFAFAGKDLGAGR